MANIVGDIAIKVGADISQLTTELNKASGHVGRFGAEAEGIGGKMAKMGAAAGAAFGVISGAAIAVGGAAKFVADTAREIERLATISGAGIEQFQALSYAASNYGINQEKLADILKDVNDKIGDFMQTGAGPMADFFTNIAPKVGVTVEQFRKLSAADALGLYVSTLEKAGVSHKELTFYMEALASDATALAPLFVNNASALRELQQAAQDMGYVIDAELIQKSARMGEIWDKMMGQMQARFIWFAATVMEGFDQIFGVTSQAQIGQLTSTLNDLTEEQIRLGEEIDTYKGRGWTALVEQSETQLGAVREEMAATSAEIQRLQALEQRAADAKAALDAMGTSDGAGNGTPPPAASAAAKGPTDAELDALRSSFSSELEVIQKQYDDRMQLLATFLDQKKLKEDEYNELSLAAQKDYNDKVVALEAARKQSMLQGLGGMFGDLSSLMSTNNKKLFAIGKAAAIAEAVVNGYSAATAAWEKGMKVGGPPLAAAFTAASLAKTGAFIAGIKSQSIGGTSGGIVGGGGAATPTAASSGQAAQTPAQTLNFTISNDPFGFGERIIRQIATQLNEASRNGSTIRATVS